MGVKTATADRHAQSVEDYRRKWLDYEQRKRQWAQRNPGATAEQFEAEVRRLMKELGL